jgi:hypothetical protein
MEKLIIAYACIAVGVFCFMIALRVMKDKLTDSKSPRQD